jgi:RimJ/RimL family protein N-acetyltransferase
MLQTERLVMRTWRDSDIDPFTAISSDPIVMEFFPKLLTRDEVVAQIERINSKITSDGFGFWALEHAGELIGFCGISRVWFDAHFTPAVEIGWRLRRDTWGHGFATEAARAAMAFGWHLGLDQIIAFLVPNNRPSAAVAERIGMTRDVAGDFDHPGIAPGTISVGGHDNQRHTLYRAKRPSS